MDAVIPLPDMRNTITTDVAYCQKLLRSNALVAIPTETVYGLAANIYNDEAVRKIFEMKGRPLFNPLIVHIHHLDQLSSLVKSVPEAAIKLAGRFWPGPLTLILEKQNVVSDLVTAGKSTLALRMPNHPLTLELLRGLDFPIAAPSANPFTRVSSTSAQHVADYFGDRIPAILDGGPCTVGLESTIVGFDGSTAVVYRKGGISLEAIEAYVGEVRLLTQNENAPQAPGMLAKHYSPRTKLVLSDDVLKTMKDFVNHEIGVLAFYESSFANAKVVETLSEERDLVEAAQNLFAALHRLDQADLDIIIAQRFPNEGLGISINDRLERAME
ncbi:L-threonylcarbamoyladenylate synthase [Ulvibacterium sp.]|uniref:L-threonylcarbamoyladenylate synthase n=1 Tax=Ulvibacterium sp. TaxID=2665914 RepID=UPI00263193F8|nr:L-threonylcarbamoyladenylate synthase [Ulvibacterium sp.]